MLGHLQTEMFEILSKRLCRGGVVVVLVILPVLGEIYAQETGFSLRFYGNGVDDIDRVKIPVDDPSNSNPGPPVDVGATDFTIEFWMKARAAENGAGAVYCGANVNWVLGNIILDRDRWGWGRDFGFSIAGGAFVVGVADESNTDRLSLCGSRNVLDDQWHHVAVQRRRSDGWLWLFVDGNLDVEADGPDGDVSYPDDGTPGNFCGGPCTNDPFVVIGAEKHDCCPTSPSYSGWVDELRFSNTLRYLNVFIPSDQPFTPDANTVALYHFDEGSGDTIIDSSGALGGPSEGARNYGGSPAGPEWSTVTPLTSPTTSTSTTTTPTTTSSTTTTTLVPSLAYDVWLSSNLDNPPFEPFHDCVRFNETTLSTDQCGDSGPLTKFSLFDIQGLNLWIGQVPCGGLNLSFVGTSFEGATLPLGGNTIAASVIANANGKTLGLEGFENADCSAVLSSGDNPFAAGFIFPEHSQPAEELDPIWGRADQPALELGPGGGPQTVVNKTYEVQLSRAFDPPPYVPTRDCVRFTDTTVSTDSCGDSGGLTEFTFVGVPGLTFWVGYVPCSGVNLIFFGTSFDGAIFPLGGNVMSATVVGLNPGFTMALEGFENPACTIVP